MDDFLSDSDDEKAVKEILAQAMDLCVVEQVAAINCAGMTDSTLPSHLETRFQKLKSFPSSTKKSGHFEGFQEALRKNRDVGKNSENNEFSTCSKKLPEEKSRSSPSESPEDRIFSPIESNPRTKMGRKVLESQSSSSFEDLSSGSVSPPVKKSGCFLCSPKKVPRKKSKVKKGLNSELDWEKNDEFLSDLSNFSVKSQRMMMKKAMKEEEEICREAEKIVKWAKHASARMDVSSIEHELSDDENLKFH